MTNEEKKMTVREWRDAYAAGVFGSNMVKAGWYDWFCSDSSLVGRTKKFFSLIKGITNDFILDNFYVWFKNNCPIVGPLYDDIRFEPLDSCTGGDESRRFEFYFVISRGDAREKHLWCVYDDSNCMREPVFGADHVRDLIKYINDKKF